MPTKRAKAVKKPPAGKAAARSAKTPARKLQPRKAAPKAARKPVGAKAAAVRKEKSKNQALDFSAFPPESITQLEKWICLACVWDVFTRHIGLAPKTALGEIKRYEPSVAEVIASEITRPFVAAHSIKDPCPYCGAPPKWITRLAICRIESGKATDAVRRELVKSLPKSDDQFVVITEKATQQHAFFEWLEKVSEGRDPDEPGWLREISQHYLSRKEPKVDWQAQLAQVHSIRRLRGLESGWEVAGGRLLLPPELFDELILVQYLVSRSHKAGGLTLEGRYTLPELFVRLRNGGYLRAVGIHAHNPSDALEQLLDRLSGGEAAVKFYYLVDRRDFLEKVKALKLGKPPKPKSRELRGSV
jgi:hypothetical protein